MCDVSKISTSVGPDSQTMWIEEVEIWLNWWRLWQETPNQLWMKLFQGKAASICVGVAVKATGTSSSDWQDLKNRFEKSIGKRCPELPEWNVWRAPHGVRKWLCQDSPQGTTGGALARRGGGRHLTGGRSCDPLPDFIPGENKSPTRLTWGWCCRERRKKRGMSFYFALSRE